MHWFKHYIDAHKDIKLRRLIFSFGMEGYGVYWSLLELLAKETKTNGEQAYNTFEMPIDVYPYEFLAHEIGVNEEKIKDIVTLMAETDLIDKEKFSHNIISCTKLAQIADDYTVRKGRIKRLEYGQKPNNNRNKTRPEEELEEEEEREGEREGEKEFQEFWNSTALTKILTWSKERKVRLKNRFLSGHFREHWKTAVEKLSKSSFALGRNDRSWKADVGWFLSNDNNYVKALEGKYDDDNGNGDDPFSKF